MAETARYSTATWDTVTSEVHHFSKEEVLDSQRGGKNHTEHGEEPVMSQAADLEPSLAPVGPDCVRLRDKDQLDEEEEEEYECLLGTNGQVVLWSPKRETVLSRFDFVYPTYLRTKDTCSIMCPKVDPDGDLMVTRKKDVGHQEGVVLIEHQSATTLDLVGEQVWRGALFLADFILHHPDTFRNTHVLEVASGVGLTSVVAAMVARKVTVTDVDKGEILQLVHRNIKRNSELLKAQVEVKEIDFCNHATIDVIQAHKEDVQVLLAADVVYHNDLTDAFFTTVLRLMSDPPDKVMFIALEKRYVFTVEDLDTVAPCYEYFLEKLEWLRCQNLGNIDWTIEQLPSDFEQCFTYERTQHLVLWRIQAKLK